MTDPIDRISGVKEAGRSNTEKGFIKREKKKQKKHGVESDSIDISSEARDRASGRKQKNILEYITE